MIKPNPAPWKAEITPGLRDTVVVVNDAEGEMVCECYEGRLEERMASARLIAAAPDLLEALYVIRDMPEDSRIHYKVARAAIAKAIGEKA